MRDIELDEGGQVQRYTSDGSYKGYAEEAGTNERRDQRVGNRAPAG